MTNEEAKEIYLRATRSMEADDFEGALQLLDGLDEARPNSRHVTYQRACCYIALKRPSEADACVQKLEGKIEDERLGELRGEIAALKESPVEAIVEDSPSAADYGDEANVLVVEAVFPASTEETTVRGHVKSGVFHTGDTVTVLSPDGMPLLAPIVRLGTAETPVKIVRAGQQAVMLLRVEPNHVVPGSSITSLVQEQSYAETMVVGSEGESAEEGEDQGATPQALLEAERMVKSGRLAEAFEALEPQVTPENESRLAHRLMARVLLDDESHHDEKKALEHARRAFELGGSEDSAVIDVLAATLGANGEAAHGLRFLERLYQKSNDMAARNALATRINDYRGKYGLGHVWEFADDYGDVVFESGDMAEIAKAIGNGTIPKAGRCRRNHIGDWRHIETTLATEHPEIGALYGKGGGASGKLLWVAVAIVTIILVGVVIYVLTQPPAG